MKAWEYDFVVYDGDTYCTDCVRATGDDVDPIFADSEWDRAPVCAECGAVCDSVTVLHADDADDAVAD